MLRRSYITNLVCGLFYCSRSFVCAWFQLQIIILRCRKCLSKLQTFIFSMIFTMLHRVTQCMLCTYLADRIKIFQIHEHHSLSNVSSVSLNKKHTIFARIDTTVLFFRITPKHCRSQIMSTPQKIFNKMKIIVSVTFVDER